MFFRLSFATLALALTAFGMPVKRDVVTVEAGLKNLDAQTLSLDASITALPDYGTSLVDLSAVQKAVANLEESIKVTINDAASSSFFSDAEINTLIGVVESYLPDIWKTLDDLVDKKPSILGGGFEHTIQDDVAALKNALDALGAVFLNKTPADLQNDVGQLISTIDSKFNNVINVF